MSEIEKYVFNRTIRLNTPFKIVNGVGYYDLNGKIITEHQFNKQYPLKAYPGMNMENKDRTKLWMNA